VLSVVFALTSAVGGILLAIGAGLPVSPYITTVSFVIYLVCRGVAMAKTRAARASVSKAVEA
jgi:zinc/manganese transport system permease protein